MALSHSPKIVTDGLVLYLDAANPKSYPGSGTTWYDLSGNGNNFTNDLGFTHTTNNNGTFSLGDNIGTKRESTITTSPVATIVYWIRTSDTQALFLSGDTGSTGSYYIGAYRSGNKEYHSNCGSPVFYKDLIDTANIYDNIVDGNWHMLEFKNLDFSVNIWPYFKFNNYTSFNFSSGELASIFIYNKNLTAEESRQNFNALRGRFGI